MKYILLFTVLLSGTLYAQNEDVLPINPATGKIEWSAKSLKPGRSKEQIYLLVSSWLLQRVRSQQEILMNDKESGVLKAYLRPKYKAGNDWHDMIITITISVQDGQVSSTITDAKLISDTVKRRKALELIMDIKRKVWRKAFVDMDAQIKAMFKEIDQL